MPNYLVNYNVLITKRGFLGRFLTFFMPRPLFSLERLGIPLFHAKPPKYHETPSILATKILNGYWDGAIHSTIKVLK
jgi:hypothetical protein